jgi:murein DD-endopeptidase MepM/ murein hydrolase activator NlpD
MARGKTSRFFIRVVVLVVVLAAVVGGIAAFRTGPPPAITMESDLPGIGRATVIRVAVAEPKRGLSRIRVELRQGEWSDSLEDRSYTPLPPYSFWGERTAEDEFTVIVGRETHEQLEEGTATVRVLADRAGGWLRRPAPVIQELELPVKLRPPTLQVTSNHTYIAQGGCEAVVYLVGESAVEDGVRAGNWWFPGHPLPGGRPQEHFALVGAPYDLDDPSQIRLVARDDVGNESTASFIDNFKRRRMREDTIRLSDDFMERVVPAILGQTPEMRDRGDLLENYLAINGELRAKNAEALTRLAAQSKPEFLWSRSFMQMPNAKVMSNFADRRTYTYEGRAVDTQDHLGFDLASTSQAPVVAANDGVVVMARYFGIYGNAVAIDHGYGLLSLYGHLSTIEIAEGANVERGQTLGRSGATGLAGGDHLHFTMLLNGLSVDPQEWWDGHWIHDRLKLKLGQALPFEE